MKISESSSPPPPGKYVSTRGNAFFTVFHLSGQVKGLLLGWCADVCDGQGKLKSGLVVVWCFNADP